MAQAENPHSVLFNPRKFGPGTTKDLIDNTKVFEHHAHRRRAGTNRHRAFLVSEQSPEGNMTSLRLIPGQEYQTVSIQQHGALVAHEIGINHTHVLISALEPTGGEVLRRAKYIWSGEQVPIEPPATQLPLGLYEETYEHITDHEPISQKSIPPLLDVPQQLDPNKATFLRRTGETISSPLNFLPSVDVIKLSTIITDHNPQPQPLGFQPPLLK